MKLALLFSFLLSTLAAGAEPKSDCIDCTKEYKNSQILVLADWPAQFLKAMGDEQQTLDLCAQVVQAHSLCEKDRLQLSADGTAVKIAASGKTIVCSDGESLGFYDRMNKMDVASTLAMPYSVGEVKIPVQSMSDPGRLRNHDLLGGVYGDSKTNVTANLVPVTLLGQEIKFNKSNGAAKALERVSKKLEELIATNKNVQKFLAPWTDKKVALSDYTFSYRKVAGTNLLSMHSYGIALDLITDKEEKPVYWLWEEAKKRVAKERGERDAAVAAIKTNSTLLTLADDKKKIAELNKGYQDLFDKTRAGIKEEEIDLYIPQEIEPVPWEIVAAFESEGFIWGGKWNHFDSMHFEYRPEFFPDYKPDCN